jgi:hypothetical protein
LIRREQKRRNGQRRIKETTDEEATAKSGRFPGLLHRSTFGRNELAARVASPLSNIGSSQSARERSAVAMPLVRGRNDTAAAKRVNAGKRCGKCRAVGRA